VSSLVEVHELTESISNTISTEIANGI
jgi:hypothetical protein